MGVHAIKVPFALVRGIARVYNAVGDMIAEFRAPALVTKTPGQLSDFAESAAARTTFTMGSHLMTPPTAKDKDQKLRAIRNSERADFVMMANASDAAKSRRASTKDTITKLERFTTEDHVLESTTGDQVSGRTLTKSFKGTTKLIRQSFRGGAGKGKGTAAKHAALAASKFALEEKKKRRLSMSVSPLGFSGTKEEEEEQLGRQKDFWQDIDWENIGDSPEANMETMWGSKAQSTRAKSTQTRPQLKRLGTMPRKIGSKRANWGLLRGISKLNVMNSEDGNAKVTPDLDADDIMEPSLTSGRNVNAPEFKNGMWVDSTSELSEPKIKLAKKNSMPRIMRRNSSVLTKQGVLDPCSEKQSSLPVNVKSKSEVDWIGSTCRLVSSGTSKDAKMLLELEK